MEGKGTRDGGEHEDGALLGDFHVFVLFESSRWNPHRAHRLDNSQQRPANARTADRRSRKRTGAGNLCGSCVAAVTGGSSPLPVA